ncbi:hypothetical protein C7C46_26540 [Streptomyces tateyamensis]|uniref:Uncharacterized protein n=1 Tax=Streptomyces tateyamensis TaxID=565073 RepID=A0A2V4NA06_9ACTN|nr:hypothetical protein [Streptomyces tateyamensis]PYC71909.1 hypothetical protein C7C46_26540 [Streptomyces tateyamensis]
MHESKMTLRVYRIASDGERTELGGRVIQAREPHGSLLDTEPPCRCAGCLRKREQDSPDEAA